LQSTLAYILLVVYRLRPVGLQLLHTTVLWYLTNNCLTWLTNLLLPVTYRLFSSTNCV